MDYKCNKHKSNEGFTTSEGIWVCWLCYKLDPIKKGDIVRPTRSANPKYRNVLFIVKRIYTNKNGEPTRVHLIPLEDMGKTIAGSFEYIEKFIP